MEQQTSKKVLLAMSGGTDSSMAAMLLLEQGYQVQGMTMVMFDSPDNQVPEFVHEAKALAAKLGIGHVVVDVRERFRETVVDYFLNEYAHGRTPNPCIRCNEQLKWAVLAQMADEIGCDWIATGHYARVEVVDEVAYVLKGLDSAKDQSYFLFRLPQAILKRALLPLGTFTKAQIKDEAARRGHVGLARKRESMGVCFMNGKPLDDFLKENLPAEVLMPGRVIDRCGLPIGKHKGSALYTIGQKKGLELPECHDWCVVGIDTSRNALTAGPSWALNSQHLWADQIYFANANDIDPQKKFQVKIRGIDQVPFHEGTVTLKNGMMHIHFTNPVWAITPGQSVVVYQGDRVIGGGVAV